MKPTRMEDLQKRISKEIDHIRDSVQPTSHVHEIKPFKVNTHSKVDELGNRWVSASAHQRAIENYVAKINELEQKLIPLNDVARSTLREIRSIGAVSDLRTTGNALARVLGEREIARGEKW